MLISLMLLTRFNSILVWLKDSYYVQIEPFDCLFQFHSGLIKSSLVLITLLKVNLFQFHSGLIKRQIARTSGGLLAQGFNSILVWLKVFLRVQVFTPKIGFNSILVWLKVTGAGFDVDHFRFQFHSGLIKRQVNVPYAVTENKFQFHSGLIKSPACGPR